MNSLALAVMERRSCSQPPGSLSMTGTMPGLVFLKQVGVQIGCRNAPPKSNVDAASTIRHINSQALPPRAVPGDTVVFGIGTPSLDVTLIFSTQGSQSEKR
jgi:hypothetical protein